MKTLLEEEIAQGFKVTELGPLPHDWCATRLGEVVDIKGGKRLPRGRPFADRATPFPYLRVTDFRGRSVDKANLKFLTATDHQLLKRYTISCDDVYISIAGTIGLVGTVPPELDGAHLTENAAKLVIRLPAQLDAQFMAFF